MQTAIQAQYALSTAAPCARAASAPPSNVRCGSIGAASSLTSTDWAAVNSRHYSRRMPASQPKHKLHAAPSARQEVAVLGGEDFIYSQQSGVEEELFKGHLLGVNADVASTSFRQTELRSLADLPDDLRPPQRFLERVAMHLARNALAGQGFVPVHVPLVLGIWGHKGAGKTFNLELCCRTLGMQPIVITAGELEDEWAGDPGKRLRERYRFAAQYAATSGTATCIIISDMDVGVGRFDNTQNTVNSQNVQGTLMAICDDPNHVTTGQDWAAGHKLLPRVPIYITANDLSRLYAPLVREGRMDKFYFAPTREELVAMLVHLFDGFSAELAGTLVDAFPSQSLDFFGAIKSRLVDSAVRDWISATTLEGMGDALLQPLWFAADEEKEGGRQGAVALKLPQSISLEAALAAGQSLAEEQQHVLDQNLALEYMKNSLPRGVPLSKQRRRRAAPPPPQQAIPTPKEILDLLAEAEAARKSCSQSGGSKQQADDGGADGGYEAAQEERAAAAAARPWPSCGPDDIAAALKGKSIRVLDVRSMREWEWGKVKGAEHCPVILTTGSSLSPVTSPNPDFMKLATSKIADRRSPILLYGSTVVDLSAEKVEGAFVSKANNVANVDFDVAVLALEALAEAGYTDVKELAGGFGAWDLAYRPDGRRREKGNWADRSSGELEWWTASN